MSELTLDIRNVKGSIRPANLRRFSNSVNLGFIENMRKRTIAREDTLKILYQLDLSKNNLEESLKDYYKEKNIDSSVKEFTITLVKGTIKNLVKIDRVIGECAENWTISRMAIIDRNILRMAIFELICLKEIPPKVSINEAIELAKKYSDEDSSKFVNGILDRVFRNCTNKNLKFNID